MIIKYCPFCGSSAFVRRVDDGIFVAYYTVECRGEFGHRLDHCADSEEEAIEVWNERNEKWIPVKKQPEESCLCWIAFRTGYYKHLEIDTCWFHPSYGWKCDEDIHVIYYIKINELPSLPKEKK